MSQQVRFAPGASLDVVFVSGTGQHPPAPIVTVQRADGSEVAIAPGHHPAWERADVVTWCQEDGWVWEATVNHRAIRTDLPAGNTLTAAAGKVAVHRTDPVRVLTSWGLTIEGATDPVLSADGRWMALLRPDVPHGGVSSLYVVPASSSPVPVIPRHTGAPLRPRFSHTGTSLAWEDAGVIYGIADVANPQSPVVRLSRPEDSLSHPVPLWVPGVGLFVLYVQASGGDSGTLMLAEWGSCVAQAPRGYVVAQSGGSGYSHDVKGAA